MGSAGNSDKWRLRTMTAVGGKLAAALCALALLSGLSGCGLGSATPLPETGAIGRPLLSPAEQKQAIADLEARKKKLEQAAAATPAVRR